VTNIAFGIHENSLAVREGGQVGIGTASPDYKLDVAGDIRLTDNLYLTDDNWVGIGAADERIIFDEAGTIAFMGANVGIGTTSPANELDVAGTIRMTGFQMTTSPSAGYVLTSDGSGVGTWTDVSGTAGPWTLIGDDLYPDSTSYNVSIGASDAGTAKLYVSGNVGIGTTAPTELLDVAGDIRSTTGTIQVGNAANQAYNRLGTANAGYSGITGATDLLIEGDLEVQGTASISALLTPYHHVITVAKQGGDFTTITAALNSITDNSSSNRYLIRVMPGTYEEQVTMKEYVDIKGSGWGATIIDPPSNGIALYGEDNSRISDIKIQNGATYGTAVVDGTNVAAADSFYMINVYVNGTPDAAGLNNGYATIYDSIIYSANGWSIWEGTFKAFNTEFNSGNSSRGISDAVVTLWNCKVEARARVGSNSSIHNTRFENELHLMGWGDHYVYHSYVQGSLNFGTPDTTLYSYFTHYEGNITAYASGRGYYYSYKDTYSDTTQIGVSLTLNTYERRDYVAESIYPLFTVTQKGTGDIVNIFDGTVEVFTILNGGSVGIGNSNPAYKLDVNGNVNIGGTATIGSVPLVSDNSQVLTVDSGVVKYIDTSSWDKDYTDDGGEWLLAGDGGTPQTIGAGNTATFAGGIGIGTTVGATDTLTINVDESYGFAWTGNQSWAGTSTFNNHVYFPGSGIWNTSGNVGIGTTGPSQLLHVAGAMRLEGALYDFNNQAGASNQILSSTGSGVDWVDITSIGVGGTGTTGYVPRWLSSSTLGDSVIFDDETNVGIGTTAPAELLDVAGDIRSTTGTIQVGNAANQAYNRLGTATADYSGITGATDLLIEGDLEVQGTASISALLTPYHHVITVAKQGGDFTTITAALNSITDNSSANTYLIRVMPGTYNEAITMKEYVDIIGSGWEVTKITTSSGTIVTGASNSRIENLAIESTSTSSVYIVYYNACSNSFANKIKVTKTDSAIHSTFIQIDGSGGVTVSNSLLGDGTNTTNGIDINAGTNTIYNNEISVGSGVGIRFDGGTNTATYNRVDGNPDFYNTGSTLSSSNNYLTGQYSTNGGTSNSYKDSYSTLAVASGTFNKKDYALAPLASASQAVLPMWVTAPTTLSSSGTYLGVNAASGYTGDYINLLLNDSSKFKVDYQGNVTVTDDAWYGIGSSSERIVFDSDGNDIDLLGGNVGIGTTAPANKLDVVGTVEMTGFKLTTSPSAGYVLTSDGAGVGTWTDVSSTAGPWTLADDDLYPDSTSYNVAIGANDAGSAKLYVNGNVGIGTTGPGAMLDISGASNKLRLTYDSTHFASLSVNSSADLVIAVDSSTARDILLTPGSDGKVGIKETNPASLLSVMGGFSLGTTTAYTRTAAPSGGAIIEGNVGIGTTGPSQLLHVAGDMRLEGALYDVNNEAGSSNQILSTTGSGVDWVDITSVGVGGTGTTGYVPKWIGSSTLGDSVIYDDGTNVGIGTTGPSGKLEVAGTTVIDSSGGSNLNIGSSSQTSGNPSLYIYGRDTGESATKYLRLYVNSGGLAGISAEESLWLSSPSVYVGADSAVTHINRNAEGPVYFFNASTSGENKYIYIYGYDTGASGTKYGTLRIDAAGDFNIEAESGEVIRFRTGGADQVTIDNSGNVGIGNANPSYKLDINGNVNIGGTATIGSVPLVSDNNQVLTTDSGVVKYIDTSSWDKDYTDDGGEWLLAGDGGTPQTIGAGNTATFAGGVGIGTTASATDTLTINVDESYGFAWTGNQSWAGSADFDGDVLIADTDITLDGASTNLAVSGDFSINNDALFIDDASGNVGIGTTGPAYKLDVDGDIGIGSGFDLYIGSIGIGATGSSNTTAGAYLIGTFDEFGNTDSQNVQDVLDDLDQAITDVSAGAGGWSDDGDVVRLTNVADEVGIGTSAPGGKLEIVADATSQIPLIVSGYSDSQTANLFQVKKYSSTSPLFMIDSGGNVGIGTTGPGANLDISSTSGAITRIQGTNTNSNSSLQFLEANSAAGVELYYSGTGDELLFRNFSDSANLMTVERSGNLGIGTNAPTDKLDVAGGMKIGSGYAGIGTTAPIDGLLIEGNVGIGTTGPGAKLESFSTGEQLRLSYDGNNYAAFTVENDGDLVVAPTTGELHIETGGQYGTLKLYDDDASDNLALEQFNSYARIQSTTLLYIQTHAEGDVLVFSSAASGENPLFSIYGYDTGASGVKYGRFNIDSAGDFNIEAESGEVIRFKTGGADQVTIDNSGNVGIGTTGPAEKLEVNGNIRIPSPYAIYNQYGSYVRPGKHYVNGNSLTLESNSSGGVIIKSTDASGIITFFSGGSSEQVRIDSSGNVGIGTTAPSQKLHIDGNMRLIGALYDFNNEAGTSNQILSTTGSGVDWVDITSVGVGGTGTTGYVPRWLSSSTLGDSVIYDDGTNVGIGTTGPSGPLHIVGATEGTGVAPLIVRNTNAYASPYTQYSQIWLDSSGSVMSWMRNDGTFYMGGTQGQMRAKSFNYQAGEAAISMATNNLAFTARSSGDYTFATDSDTDLNIGSGQLFVEGSSGNVGIGTTGPGAKLDVAGHIYPSSDATYHLGSTSRRWSSLYATYWRHVDSDNYTISQGASGNSRYNSTLPVKGYE
jgi:hypothetical protein